MNKIFLLLYLLYAEGTVLSTSSPDNIVSTYSRPLLELLADECYGILYRWKTLHPTPSIPHHTQTSIPTPSIPNQTSISNPSIPKPKPLSQTPLSPNPNLYLKPLYPQTQTSISNPSIPKPKPLSQTPLSPNPNLYLKPLYPQTLYLKPKSLSQTLLFPSRTQTSISNLSNPNLYPLRCRGILNSLPKMRT